MTTNQEEYLSKNSIFPSLNSSVNEINVTVTDYNCNNVNPSPIKLPKDGVELLEEFLSPRKLQALTGVENLETVEYLEMRVNTEQMSLGNFGMYLPNLTQIRLSGSFIPSIRDLGTSLWNLQVLWMPQCNLFCLDGLVTLSSLRELYLAYNEIEDISSCGMLENLEILDLEGNMIEDSANIHYLSMCRNLTRLTLESNPLCRISPPDYHQSVLECLPQLQYLNDIPRDEFLLSFESTTNRSGNGDETSPEIRHSTTLDDDFESHWNFINSVLMESGLLASSKSSNDEVIITGNKTNTNNNKSRSLYSPGDSGRPTSSSLSSSACSYSQNPLGMPGSSIVNAPPLSARPSSSSGGYFRRPISSAGAGPRPDTSSTLDSLSDNGSHSEGLEDSNLTAGGLVCGSLTKSLRRTPRISHNNNQQHQSPLYSQNQIASSRDQFINPLNSADIMNSLRLSNGIKIGPKLRPQSSRVITDYSKDNYLVETNKITNNSLEQTSSNHKTKDSDEFDETKCDEILKELSQWREEYNKSKARIEAYRAPQVLTIEYAENEIEEMQITKRGSSSERQSIKPQSTSMSDKSKSFPASVLQKSRQISESESPRPNITANTKILNPLKATNHPIQKLQNKSPASNSIAQHPSPQAAPSTPPSSSTGQVVAPQMSRIRRQLMQAGSHSLIPSKPTLKKSV